MTRLMGPGVKVDIAAKVSVRQRGNWLIESNTYDIINFDALNRANKLFWVPSSRRDDIKPIRMKLQPLLLSRCKIKAWTVCWSLKICKLGRITMARYQTRPLWLSILVTEGEFLLTIRLQSDNCMEPLNILIWPRLYHNRTAYLGYPEGLEVNIHIMSNLWQYPQNWHWGWFMLNFLTNSQIEVVVGDLKSWHNLLQVSHHDTENLYFPGVGEEAASCEIFFLLIRMSICKTIGVTSF